MVGFVSLLILFVAVVGGLIYGFAYLKAKATKQPVDKTLVDMAEILFKKD